jgi:hypothetical protein
MLSRHEFASLAAGALPLMAAYRIIKDVLA